MSLNSDAFDLVICNLDPSASFTMEFTINKGRGWTPAEENEVPATDVNYIAIDSIYTPIVNIQTGKEFVELGK